MGYGGVTVDTAELRRLLAEYESDRTRAAAHRRVSRAAVNALPGLLDRIEEMEAVAALLLETRDYAASLEALHVSHGGDLVKGQELGDRIDAALAALDEEEK